MRVHASPTGIDTRTPHGEAAAKRPGADGRTPMAVIVMGVSGSGKSTLGARLAQAMRCPFLEGDAFHDAAAIARMRAGMPLGDADRWPWLDRLGMAVAAATAADGVAVAACSALKRSYRARLAMAVDAPTRFVLLDTDPDTLRRRLERREDHYMPPTLLASQLATLERPGPAEAVLTLDGALGLDRLCAASLAWLDGAA